MSREAARPRETSVFFLTCETCGGRHRVQSAQHTRFRRMVCCPACARDQASVYIATGADGDVVLEVVPGPQGELRGSVSKPELLEQVRARHLGGLRGLVARTRESVRSMAWPDSPK
jgi:hypothetical protein